MSDNADWASRYEGMLDRQIRAAEERGEFADLPGAGKPLASESIPYSPDWWVNQLVEREKIGAYAVPPALALRKIADELRKGARGFRTERDVRSAVVDYNERADYQRKLPQEGRAVVLPTLDADEIVEGWRQGRQGDVGDVGRVRG
jgi:Domain of unknown function (DUF1992)